MRTQLVCSRERRIVLYKWPSIKNTPFTPLNSRQHTTKHAINTTEQSATHHKADHVHHWTACKTLNSLCNTPQSGPCTPLNSLQHTTQQTMYITEQSAKHWTVCKTPQSGPCTPLNSLQHTTKWTMYTTEQSATHHKADHVHHWTVSATHHKVGHVHHWTVCKTPLNSLQHATKQATNTTEQCNTLLNSLQHTTK